MFLAANIQMRSTTNQDEKLETVGKFIGEDIKNRCFIGRNP